MDIFKVTGIVVWILIVIIIIGIIHSKFYTKSKFYRNLLDWIALPYYLYWRIPRMFEDLEHLENSIKWMKDSKHSNSIRFKLGIRMMEKQKVKFLNSKERE